MTTQSFGFKRLNQSPLHKLNERVIILRQSLMTLSNLYDHSEREEEQLALENAITSIKKEISRLTIRS